LFLRADTDLDLPLWIKGSNTLKGVIRKEGVIRVAIKYFASRPDPSLPMLTAGQLDALFAVSPKARSRISAAIESPFLSASEFVAEISRKRVFALWKKH